MIIKDNVTEILLSESFYLEKKDSHFYGELSGYDARKNELVFEITKGS